MKYYAGIGSRETPGPILQIMLKTAQQMAGLGFTLRSGAADGADAAFELGADLKEIYLPWLGFNGSDSKLLPTKEAFLIAEKFHPAWDKCSPAAKKLHARNCHQVLGQDLNTPSALVICWTHDGAGGGGTGQAIRIAKAHGIPVHDLANPLAAKILKSYLGE
jgi:hypothetical protein